VNSEQLLCNSFCTGCGKTTQIPQFILDEMISRSNGSLCNLLCTQPRRISAISVAERVAEERGERIGSNSVGYVIRLENRTPSRNKGTITFCTTGVVFQYLKSDPYLTKYSHIILDEVGTELCCNVFQ
jgi:ATP-dependent RNA helicase DHX36